MPFLTVQFAANGPLIDLMIGVSHPREQALRKAAQPVPAAVVVRGLIDTGASCTCIDPEIVSMLSLVPTGTTAMLTPSTGTAPHQCNQFDVRIILTHPDISFTFEALPVIESCLKHQGIRALIGRDILSRCMFVYDGKNAIFSLAF